jgi:ADP-heptose:LPS heptosyltransferase
MAASQKVDLLLLWSPGQADDPRHPGDDAKAAAIQRAVSIVAARTDNLADLIAVLSLCRAFVGADGGAMHIAAGLGLPTVALFENLESKKRRWYPWRVPYELVAPQTRDIADITISQVTEAWQRLCRSTALGARTQAPTA